jgi:hypothetical protein
METKKETKKAYIFGATLIITTILSMLFALDTFAQNKTKTDWIEHNTVEIPYSVEINKGVTKNGNPKYWIDIKGVSVLVSEGNYKKFINKEVVLLLVEWYNPTTDKYKYTTRQKAKSNDTKKIDLDKLW